MNRSTRKPNAVMVGLRDWNGVGRVECLRVRQQLPDWVSHYPLSRSISKPHEQQGLVSG